MAQLNVRYHNGRKQAVPADRYDSNSDYWRFTRNGEEVALIAKKSVESITTEDVPDPEEPEAPEVEVSEMQRSGRGHGFN